MTTSNVNNQQTYFKSKEGFGKQTNNNSHHGQQSGLVTYSETQQHVHSLNRFHYRYKGINKNLSTLIDGEDSECKFEDQDKECSLKQDSVLIIQEEAQIEEEESKKSDIVNQQISFQSTPHNKTASK
mmetsp:Transcript_22745/g.21943  ORF Transcript_22745/g.21943 Transcript_22745/m.21943 type:complete len:127 (+) Transcript_22745:393-773(+)